MARAASYCCSAPFTSSRFSNSSTPDRDVLLDGLGRQERRGRAGEDKSGDDEASRETHKPLHSGKAELEPL